MTSGNDIRFGYSPTYVSYTCKIIIRSAVIFWYKQYWTSSRVENLLCLIYCLYNYLNKSARNHAFRCWKVRNIHTHASRHYDANFSPSNFFDLSISMQVIVCFYNYISTYHMYPLAASCSWFIDVQLTHHPPPPIVPHICVCEMGQY